VNDPAIVRDRRRPLALMNLLAAIAAAPTMARSRLALTLGLLAG
jgi:hypothetical protein